MDTNTLCICVCFIITMGECDSGTRICGLKPYNLRTHLCKNSEIINTTAKPTTFLISTTSPPRKLHTTPSHVQPESLMELRGRHELLDRFCGTEMYDLSTHVCKNFAIYKIETREEPLAYQQTTPPHRQPLLPRIPVRTAKPKKRPTAPPATVTNTPCGILRAGYQCCGNEQYHPHFETCCIMSQNKYKIYSNKKQKEHVCCDLAVFRRGSSNLTCDHPSKNDYFSKALPLKRVYEDQDFCMASKYAYRLKIGVKSSLASFTYYKSRLTLLKSNRPTKRSKTVLVPYDKFSPKIHLHTSIFLILSNTDYFIDNGDFYLKSTDRIYRGPRKSRAFKRKLKRGRNKCRQNRR